MIDTAARSPSGGQLLRERGAHRVLACATHPVFSRRHQRLSETGPVEERGVGPDQQAIPIVPRVAASPTLRSCRRFAQQMLG